jgi:hypothetical protein
LKEKLIIFAVFLVTVFMFLSAVSETTT